MATFEITKYSLSDYTQVDNPRIFYRVDKYTLPTYLESTNDIFRSYSIDKYILPVYLEVTDIITGNFYSIDKYTLPVYLEVTDIIVGDFYSIDIFKLFDYVTLLNSEDVEQDIIADIPDTPVLKNIEVFKVFVN